MCHRSNVKTQTMKPLKENVQEYLYDLGESKDFLEWRNRVVAITEKKIGLYKN